MTGDAIDHGVGGRKACRDLIVAGLAQHNSRNRRRPASRTDHAGVGLGLAIVKSITKAHDGTLTLIPRAAGGLHVTVQLPAAPR